jgi:hypothetical protein
MRVYELRFVADEEDGAPGLFCDASGQTLSLEETAEPRKMEMRRDQSPFKKCDFMSLICRKERPERQKETMEKSLPYENPRAGPPERGCPGLALPPGNEVLPLD